MTKLVVLLAALAGCGTKDKSAGPPAADKPMAKATSSDDTAELPPLDCTKVVDDADIKPLFEDGVAFTRKAWNGGCEIQSATGVGVTFLVMKNTSYSKPEDSLEGGQPLAGFGDKAWFTGDPVPKAAVAKGNVHCIASLGTTENVNELKELAKLSTQARVERLATICLKVMK